MIGILDSPEEVNLAAQVGGRIQSLRIQQGDAVQAGQLLARLEVPARFGDQVRPIRWC